MPLATHQAEELLNTVYTALATTFIATIKETTDQADRRGSNLGLERDILDPAARAALATKWRVKRGQPTDMVLEDRNPNEGSQPIYLELKGGTDWPLRRYMIRGDPYGGGSFDRSTQEAAKYGGIAAVLGLFRPPQGKPQADADFESLRAAGYSVLAREVAGTDCWLLILS